MKKNLFYIKIKVMLFILVSCSLNINKNEMNNHFSNILNFSNKNKHKNKYFLANNKYYNYEFEKPIKYKTISYIRFFEDLEYRNKVGNITFLMKYLIKNNNIDKKEIIASLKQIKELTSNDIIDYINKKDKLDNDDNDFKRKIEFSKTLNNLLNCKYKKNEFYNKCKNLDKLVPPNICCSDEEKEQSIFWKGEINNFSKIYKSIDQIQFNNDIIHKSLAYVIKLFRFGNHHNKLFQAITELKKNENRKIILIKIQDLNIDIKYISNSNSVIILIPEYFYRNISDSLKKTSNSYIHQRQIEPNSNENKFGYLSSLINNNQITYSIKLNNNKELVIYNLKNNLGQIYILRNRLTHLFLPIYIRKNKFIKKGSLDHICMSFDKEKLIIKNNDYYETKIDEEILNKIYNNTEVCYDSSRLNNLIDIVDRMSLSNFLDIVYLENSIILKNQNIIIENKIDKYLKSINFLDVFDIEIFDHSKSIISKNDILKNKLLEQININNNEDESSVSSYSISSSIIRNYLLSYENDNDELRYLFNNVKNSNMKLKNSLKDFFKEYDQNKEFNDFEIKYCKTIIGNFENNEKDEEKNEFSNSLSNSIDFSLNVNKYNYYNIDHKHKKSIITNIKFEIKRKQENNMKAYFICNCCIL